ncbi:hypothetical protein SK128_006401, partial [Halocaridina rubra]
MGEQTKSSRTLEKGEIEGGGESGVGGKIPAPIYVAHIWSAPKSHQRANRLWRLV